MNDKCAKSIYAPNVNLRVLDSSLIRLATSFKFFPMMPKLKLISTKVILKRNICERITLSFIFFHYLFWKRVESYIFRIKVSPIKGSQQKISLENESRPKFSSENDNQQKFSSLNDDQQTFLPEKFNDNQPTENENQQKFSPENENQQKISPENENQQKQKISSRNSCLRKFSPRYNTVEKYSVRLTLPDSAKMLAGLVLLLAIASNDAFNLDTDSIVTHQGIPGSQFGFSVTQHKDRDGIW